MPMEPFTLRWGILGITMFFILAHHATGNIAKDFAREDILTDPADRNVYDVSHIITAIGSSTSLAKARDFAQSVGAKHAKCYDNYDELVNDPDVDAIYVATPHSHHYDNVKSALNAGKHVLCEKPFTVNGAQAKVLAALAREKKRFLLEAVWTRFFPLSTQIRDLISSGRLGQVTRVFADIGMVLDKNQFGLKHRLYNPDLAGGSLLDIGAYSLTWVMQTIYDAQKARNETPLVTGALVLDKDTGVDESAGVVLKWNDGIQRYSLTGSLAAIGIATSSFTSPTDGNGLGTAGPGVKILGTKASITVPWPIYRPTEYTIHYHEGGRADERHTVDIPGKGMHWQADATARGIRISSAIARVTLGDGELESQVLPLSETILLMEIMDRVRELGGLKYPEHIEKY